MNREELKTILPHREPMLLVDSAERIDDRTATGFYRVKGDEYFLQGHFPDSPVVPGVILCEMAGQSCCILFADKLQGKLPLFSGMNKVKFRTPAKPGMLLRFECTAVREVGVFSFVEVKGYADDKLCMSAELSFAVVEAV